MMISFALSVLLCFMLHQHSSNVGVCGTIDWSAEIEACSLARAISGGLPWKTVNGTECLPLSDMRLGSRTRWALARSRADAIDRRRTYRPACALDVCGRLRRDFRAAFPCSRHFSSVGRGTPTTAPTAEGWRTGTE